MIGLLLTLALSNLPPYPPNSCPGKEPGTSCLTQRQTNGVCVHAQCPKTEFSKAGSKTVQVDCMKCEESGADGGTK